MTSCIIRENGDLGNNSEDGGGKEGGGEEERFVERSLTIASYYKSLLYVLSRNIYFFSLSLSSGIDPIVHCVHERRTERGTNTERGSYRGGNKNKGFA